MEGGKQAGVSAAAKFPYQMWAAGEFHVDPLKGVRPKAGLSSPVLFFFFLIYCRTGQFHPCLQIRVRDDKIQLQSSENKRFLCWGFFFCFFFRLFFHWWATTAFSVPSTRLMKGRVPEPDVCGRQQGHWAIEAILSTFPEPWKESFNSWKRADFCLVAWSAFSRVSKVFPFNFWDNVTERSCFLSVSSSSTFQNNLPPCYVLQQQP